MQSQFSPGVIRLLALGAGAAMLVLITVFHGVGLHRVVRRYKVGEKKVLAHRPHQYRVSLIFGIAVYRMLALHLIEIFFWSVGLWKLKLVGSFGDAFYFCANAYTTLGFGKVVIAEEWRMISPIIAISGLFTFAWTASTLVNVVTRSHALHDQIEAELEKEAEMRTELATETRVLHEKEAAAEDALRAKEKQDAAGKPFLERHKLKGELSHESSNLRREERTQEKEAHRTEREAETHLGETSTKSGPSSES